MATLFFLTLAPFALIMAVLLGLIAYCSEPEIEILPTALRERSERICRKETGYLPPGSQGPRARCYFLIKEYMDAEFREHRSYPGSLDSLIGAHGNSCYPLGIEKKIEYEVLDGGADFRIDRFGRSELEYRKWIDIGLKK